MDPTSVIDVISRPGVDEPETNLLSTANSLWQICTAGTSSQSIVPDTFVGIEFGGDSRISDYPVEQGAFASYNKVQMPSEIRVTLACAGEQMDRHSFLTQLEAMKQSTDLYDIATPDQLYQSYNLVHYDYSRRSSNGVSMVVVELRFEQIRQTGGATYSAVSPSAVSANGSTIKSASPSASDPADLGTISPTTPTAAQQSSIPTGGPL